jgi:C4-type Zn-finger protein
MEHVKIKCPNCDNILIGTIEFLDWMPYPSYFGHCRKCDYYITESEWEPVEI